MTAVNVSNRFIAFTIETKHIHKVSEKRPLLYFTPLMNQIKINIINQLLSTKSLQTASRTKLLLTKTFMRA